MDAEEIRIWKNPAVLETEMDGPDVGLKIEMLVHFRHETMSFRYTSELFPLWQARNWAAEEFGVRHNLLRMDIRFRNQRLVRVFLNERLIPREHFDDPPLIAVWVGQDDRRFWQYRGQRALDIVHEMGARDGREHATPLMRYRRLILQGSALLTDERLSKIPPERHTELTDAVKEIEIYAQDGMWSLSMKEAKTWLGKLSNMIFDRRFWVIRSGITWTDGFVMEGGVFRVTWLIPTGFPRVPKIGLDFAIRRFEGMVYWRDWCRSQEEERITRMTHRTDQMHSPQKSQNVGSGSPEIIEPGMARWSTRGLIG
jgi:phenolic acid decarboxylase